MKQHAKAFEPKRLPKSTLGKAVNYFLNEYHALAGYREDGRFEIANNLVEKDIRPTAVDCKWWLFIGHPEAGWRSAVIYSILISCRRRGLNPQEYLLHVLTRLPSTQITQLQELLPARRRPPLASNSPPPS
jgi:transposase